MLQMWVHPFNVKCFLFLVCLFLLKLSTEQGNAEFTVQRSSPNWTVIAKGKTLQLNIILNGTEDTMPMLVFLDWNFQGYHSSSAKRLLSVTWDRGHVVSEEFYDARASISDSASLLLIDTTLKDSGTYWCNVFSLPSQHYPVLYFNVTVQGKPTAEIECAAKVNVTEGKNFTCLCSATSLYLTPTASWKKKGVPKRLHGESGRNSEKLDLKNVNKEMAGTYVCKAELYSMLDEKELILAVHYAPRILTFRGKVLNDESMKMTCHAEGVPKPTYTIKISNGMVYTAGVNGMVVVKDYGSIVNASYTCIAKNSVGEDKWHLNGILTVSKDETDEKDESFLDDHVWYVICGSSIAGILFGLVLFKTCQSVFCKKSKRGREGEQPNDMPVYIDLATLPMSQGRKKDPLNYIDVHVLPCIPQRGVGEDMPVYVDPDTVVPSREKLRQAREENRASQDMQATESSEEQKQVPVVTEPKEDDESIEDNRAGEEIQEANEQQSEPTCVPVTRTRQRAATELMQGYQDLDSSDEIEENFYHSLRSASEGPSMTEYYVNESVKVEE